MGLQVRLSLSLCPGTHARRAAVSRGGGTALHTHVHAGQCVLVSALVWPWLLSPS